VSVLCLLFSAWPELDLRVSAAFYSPESGFAGQRSALVRGIYDAVPWFGRGSGLLALGVALVWWRRPGLLGRRTWRRVVALGLAMAVGTGVMVNGVFKEGWGRARPVAVSEFGGQARFTPALRQTNQCRTNCSFVSGHSATGFTLLAVGLFAAPATRRRWWLVGGVAGLLVGAVRIAQGGHFLSDVLFSGVIVWICCAAVREAWLRGVARRRRLAQRRAQASQATIA
jgi:lipid A 4'-phosphatase